MSMQRYDDYNDYGDRQMRPHRGNYEMEPFFGGNLFGGIDHVMRSMTRDLARMEKQIFGSSDTPNIGSMINHNMTMVPNFIEREGQQLAQFQLDVRGFKPEDITIRTSENVMTVTARHEDKSDDHHAIREFRRMVTIPPGMQMEGMKSRLAPNGVLSIEAPFTPQANRQGDFYEIPIQHSSSSNRNSIQNSGQSTNQNTNQNK